MRFTAYLLSFSPRYFTSFFRGLEAERCSVIYSQVEGATSSEAALKLDLYGSNSIEIEVRPLLWLIIDEVSQTLMFQLTPTNTFFHLFELLKITGPFYLYQFFICSIWLIQLYYQFATCILLLSAVSVRLINCKAFVSLYQSQYFTGGHACLANSEGSVY